jgi:hypothetical protein
VARLVEDSDLLADARREAARVIAEDPNLAAPRWDVLRQAIERRRALWHSG